MFATFVANNSWPKVEWVANWDVHNTVESPCTVCDKIFRNKKHLADHMSNTHAENQRFSCDFKTGESACSYYSTTKSNLRAHKKRVHEKTIDAIPPKHACGLCGYRTNSKFSLSRHKEKCNRSLNQNPIDHICNICAKKFSTKKIFSAASCVVCKKTFVNNCMLLTAMTILMENCTSEGSLLQLILLLWPKIDRVWDKGS